MKVHQFGGVAAAALFALANGAEAQTNTSKLMIHIPHSLFREEGYDHREALFGIPHYGGSIAQNVRYANSRMCFWENPFPSDPPEGPFILMVDRGECTFVTKVRNAQRLGAAAVLIADNTCLCRDTTCQMDSNLICEDREPTMADDGSGSDVTIPAFLMFKTDADKIKAELSVGKPVQVEMAWKLPNPDDRVEYDLWTTPTDFMSQDFLQNFKDVAIALGDRAYFTPHYYVYDGESAGCAGGNSDCQGLCTNNGRYCASEPGGWGDLVSASGSDVVRESLRQLCVWKHYGEQNGIGGKWWDYVHDFQRECAQDSFSGAHCINGVFKQNGIDGDSINHCMQNSGGLDRDSTNAFLSLEIQSRNDRGIIIVPTAVVNKVPIRGSLTANNVFDAICSGFAPGTEPDICSHCAHCANVNACARYGGVCTMERPGYANGTAKDKISYGVFFFWMFVVVAGFAGAGVWYYKRTRDEMRDHVRGILAEYMPLEDQEQQNGAPAASNPMAFMQPNNQAPGFFS